MVTSLLDAAQSDPVFADRYHARFVEPRRARGRAILAAAADDGQLPADTDIELALDLLYGPIYHRLLQGHAQIDDRFVRDIVDVVCAGLSVPR